MDVGWARVGPPAAHVVEAEVDGHISLFNPLTSCAHVLNGTATDTWLLSDGDHTAEQIVTLLARAYGIDADQIRATVLHTVRLFHDEGLLRPPDGPA